MSQENPESIEEIATALVALEILRPFEPPLSSLELLVRQIRIDQRARLVQFDTEGFVSDEEYTWAINKFASATDGALKLADISVIGQPPEVEWEPFPITASVTINGKVRVAQWIQTTDDWVEDAFLDFMHACVEEGTGGRFVTLPAEDQTLEEIFVADPDTAQRTEELFRKAFDIEYT